MKSLEEKTLQIKQNYNTVKNETPAKLDADYLLTKCTFNWSFCHVSKVILDDNLG